MNSIEFQHELNCKGMNCPLPILKTKKAVDGIARGEVLKMVATDPGSINDMNAWCRRTGHELIAQQKTDEEITFYIKKK